MLAVPRSANFCRVLTVFGILSPSVSKSPWYHTQSTGCDTVDVRMDVRLFAFQSLDIPLCKILVFFLFLSLLLSTLLSPANSILMEYLKIPLGVGYS